MQRKMWHVAIVMVVAATVLFANLGGPRLWDRDEPRNAGCALEMMQRADWITPTFNAELRSHKPVLLYWLMMIAYGVFGVGEFAARFWSAALGVGTALCTQAIGRRLLSPMAGMWAGIVVATSLLFGVAGRAATPDSLVMFLSTLAITIYVQATFRPTSSEELSGGEVPGPQPRVAGVFFPRQWLVAAAIYAVMGLGVLAKGPVGVVLPTAVVGMFLLIMRLPVDGAKKSRSPLPVIIRAFHPGHFLRTCWSMRPLTALATVCVVALPWYLWVGFRTDGEFLRGFFLEHNLGRATSSMEGHRGGPLFYPAALVVGLFPWSVFLAPLVVDTIARSRRGDPWKVGYLLAACWGGVYVCLFSLAKTKLPSYVTPCYPGLALIVGGFICQFSQGRELCRQIWNQLAMAAFSLVGLGLLIALPIVAHRILPGEEWTGLIGLIPLLGGLATWILMERGKRPHAAAAFAVTATLLMTTAFGLIAARVSDHQHIQRLLTAIDVRGAQTRLASFGVLEPSWIFYSRRAMMELPWSGDAESLGGWVEISGAWQPKPPLGVSDVADSNDDWLIITTDANVQRLMSMLPVDYVVLSTTPYFLKDQELLLLGRNLDTTRVVSRPEAPLE